MGYGAGLGQKIIPPLLSSPPPASKMVIGDLYITGYLYIISYLYIIGYLYITGYLYILGNPYIVGYLYIIGYLCITGYLYFMPCGRSKMNHFDGLSNQHFSINKPKFLNPLGIMFPPLGRQTSICLIQSRPKIV